MKGHASGKTIFLLVRSMNDLPINLEYNITSFNNLQLNFWGIPKCGSSTIKHILLRADDLSLFKKYDGRKAGSANWAHGQCKYITPTQAKHNNILCEYFS